MAHPTTGALTAGAPSHFPQSGSWAMLDLAKFPIEATVGILSRYSAGRVNPYTVLVCHNLCGQFRLTTQGRANIDDAVGSLTAVGTVGTALEFGFGIEDLIRSMTKSEQGTISLALCAALKEVYLLDVSTEVLLEMARLSKVGGEWMPSSREWQALLKACSGVLSTTTFGTRAEVFMQMQSADQRLGAFQRVEAMPQNVRKCSSPKSIAEALAILSAVTREELQAVTLVGGSDIGWMAAVAEWMLNLKISITDAQGQERYTNADNSESIQAHFIFRDEASTAKDEIVPRGRTYILKEISEILGDDETTILGSTVSGRLEWKTALRSAFLADFKDLMSLPDTFGTLLGCAGRIYKAIAQADKSIPAMYFTACTAYGDQSMGAGFVGNTLSWFPELAKLRSSMEKAVALSLADARRDYEANIARLRQVCACRACTTSSNGFDLDGEVEMTPAPGLDEDEEVQLEEGHAGEHQDASQSDDESDWDPDTYCAVIIVETIIVLSRTLSNVRLDNPKLLPMRSGFELAYGRQLSMRRSAQSGATAIRELGQFAFCMDFDANFSFGMRHNDYGTGLHLDMALELFSGERLQLSSDGVSAACSNGLCAYFAFLKDGSLANSAGGSIRIIPGRIQYEKKSYPALEDRAVIEDADFDSTIRDLYRDASDCRTLELSVRESATALKCVIRLPFMEEKERVIIASPANLVDFLAARRGLVRCSNNSSRGRSCRKLTDLTVDERNRLAVNGGCFTADWLKVDSVQFFRCKDSLTARAVLVHCAVQYLHRASIFIVNNECVDCCLRVASKIERVGHLYFIFVPDG